MEKNLSHRGLIKFLDFIREVMPAKHALLHLCNGPQIIVPAHGSPAFSREKRRVFEMMVQQAIKDKNPVVLSDQTEKYFIGGKESRCRRNACSILCIPLVFWDVAAGALYLERDISHGPFTEKSLEALGELIGPLYHIIKDRMNCISDNPKREFTGSPLIGTSASHKKVLRLMDKVRNNDVPVFIWGESGTGKELAARTIHETGHRRQKPFIAVNCGAIPESLLESELFGHVRGAFTGAMRDRRGLVDEADGGTFFLDEIGDLSLSLQSKLLRLLQEKEFRRVGDNRLRRADVRFISATNKNLEQKVTCGSFREDLYYRLKIITIDIPPLRERKEDIICLLNHFLGVYTKQMKRDRTFFSPRCLELLLHYSWPGNVREIQNEIQRCLILSGSTEFIKEEHLSPRINPGKERYSPVKYNYFHAKAEFEKRFLNQALAKFRYNRAKTAEGIGISRQGLFKLIKKHNISIPLDLENHRIRPNEQA